MALENIRFFLFFFYFFIFLFYFIYLFFFCILFHATKIVTASNNRDIVFGQLPQAKTDCKQDGSDSVCEGAIIFRIAMAATKDVDKLQALNYICILEDDVDKGWGSTLKDWLQRYAWNRIILWKDQDGKGIDARIDLRNEMCPWYKYLRAQNCRKQCRQWHICKRFLEGDCNGECGRSHDFFDKGNRENTEKLGLDRFSNERIRRIVRYSFPEVCLLYVKGTCPSDDCPHLHICPSVVQQTPCDCPLVHNNDELNTHNKNILEIYGLITKFSTRINYLGLFNILVPVEQRSFEWNKYSFQARPNKMPSANKNLFSGNRKDPQGKKLKLNLPSTSSDSQSPEAKENVNYAVHSRPSSCCIDKEKVAIKRNQRKEKMPHQSKESNLTSQVSKSIFEIPSVTGNVPGLFSRRYIDKERTGVVEGKEKRKGIARLSNAESRSTSQESKCSPGLSGLTCDMPIHFKSFSIDKGKGAVEEHHGNEKLPPSSSDPETISGLTLSVTAGVFVQALEEPKKHQEMKECRTNSALFVATQDLPASKAKGSLKSKDSNGSAEFRGLTSGSAMNAAPESIEEGRRQPVASLIQHFESIAETCRVKDDLPNHSNSHAVTKGRKAAERHHERPPRTSEERFKTLYVAKSLSKTPGVSDFAPRQPNPHYLYNGKKEAFLEDQTIDKVSPSSSYRSLTSQVSKSITGNATESEGIRSYPSPNCMKKEEAGKVHHERQKIPAGSSDVSFTSRKSKSVPGTANASGDRHSYPSNPPFIDNGQGADKGKRKEEKRPARSLGSRSTTQASKIGFPGITVVPDDVRSYSSLNSVNDKGIMSRKQEEEETHQSVAGNKSSSLIFKRRSVVKGSATVPGTKESKSRRVRHSDASKLHPIDNGREAFEGNRKSATNNVRNETNDVPSHPYLSSSAQERKDFPQGCQKEKLLLRDSEGKDTQQHER